MYGTGYGLEHHMQVPVVRLVTIMDGMQISSSAVRFKLEAIHTEEREGTSNSVHQRRYKSSM